MVYEGKCLNYCRLKDWPKDEQIASRAAIKFEAQSFSRGHYHSIYQQAKERFAIIFNTSINFGNALFIVEKTKQPVMVPVRLPVYKNKPTS